MGKDKHGEKEKSSRSSTRLNVVLSPGSKARLDRIVEMMEAETTTEAVKDSFRLLEYFLKKSQEGGKFYVKMPDEDIKQIEFFGISTK